MNEGTKFSTARVTAVKKRDSVSEPVFDLQGTMVRLAGDEELFGDLVGFFFEDAPRLLAEVRSAANTNDAQALRSAAHALKGLIAGCGGVRAAQAAQKVETAAYEGDLSKIDKLTASLSAEYDLFAQAVGRFRK